MEFNLKVRKLTRLIRGISNSKGNDSKDDKKEEEVVSFITTSTTTFIKKKRNLSVKVVGRALEVQINS